MKKREEAVGDWRHTAVDDVTEGHRLLAFCISSYAQSAIHASLEQLPLLPHPSFEYMLLLCIECQNTTRQRDWYERRNNVRSACFECYLWRCVTSHTHQQQYSHTHTTYSVRTTNTTLLLLMVRTSCYA